MASFSKHPEKKSGEPANIPPEIQDLHCFTETGGVITTTMFDVSDYALSSSTQLGISNISSRYLDIAS